MENKIKRPNRKDYDLDMVNDSINYAWDLAKYVDYIEGELEKFNVNNEVKQTVELSTPELRNAFNDGYSLGVRTGRKQGEQSNEYKKMVDVRFEGKIKELKYSIAIDSEYYGGENVSLLKERLIAIEDMKELIDVSNFLDKND